MPATPFLLSLWYYEVVKDCRWVLWSYIIISDRLHIFSLQSTVTYQHSMAFISHWQVTYTFSTLEVKSLEFPHHFHMVPSEIHLANGITTLIQHFGWTRVNIIRQESPVYLAVSNYMCQAMNLSTLLHKLAKMLRYQLKIGIFCWCFN